MEPNLEVCFCDLCNASVPLRDLETGTAKRINGKVVGACCLAVARERSGADTQAPSASRAGMAGVAVVLIAAVAGAALFLDWRLSEELTNVGSSVSGVQGMLHEQQERLRALEERLGQTLTATDLETLGGNVARLQEELAASEARVRAMVERTDGQVAAVGRSLTEMQEAQRQHASGMERVGRGVEQLSAEVAALSALPRSAPNPAPVEAAAPPPVERASELPPELAHHVSRLSDADPGTRFDAVDKLVQSKNPAVVGSLVDMAKDSDMFVRRLTVDGLGQFHTPESVEALLTALADQETIVRRAAHDSLTKLTGQNIPFDPDAKKEERRAAQQRWQDWWEKNRAAF
jgi:hypothetical protein